MGDVERDDAGYAAGSGSTVDDDAKTLELEDGREVLYRTCMKREQVDDETYQHPFVMVRGVVGEEALEPIVPGDRETRDYVRDAIVERLKDDETFRSYAEDAVEAKMERMQEMVGRFDGTETPLQLPDVGAELERTIQFSPDEPRSRYTGPAAD